MHDWWIARSIDSARLANTTSRSLMTFPALTDLNFGLLFARMSLVIGVCCANQTSMSPLSALLLSELHVTELSRNLVLYSTGITDAYGCSLAPILPRIRSCCKNIRQTATRDPYKCTLPAQQLQLAQVSTQNNRTAS